MPARKRTLATRVWRAIFDFIVLTAEQRSRIIGTLGLTPNESRALTTLATGRPQPMSALAAAWGCDASTATWIIDRLERRGLVSRRADSRDRRVLLVALTRRGGATRSRLRRALYAPPPELLDLEERELSALRRATERLPKARRPRSRD